MRDRVRKMETRDRRTETGGSQREKASQKLNKGRYTWMEECVCVRVRREAVVLLGGLEESRVSYAQEVGVIEINMGCIRLLQTRQGQATPPSTAHR